MDNLISTKEAAKILNVSTSALRKWRERKLFGVPFFPADEQHGGSWYYYRERVEQLKSVYQKGILQNMYRLADAFDALPSADFQKRGTTVGLLSTDFYSTESVAKILGVDEKTLRNWRDKKIFVEDYQTHVGIALYNQDRVLEMKLFCQKNQAEQASSTLFEEVLQSGETPSKVLKRLNIQIRPSKVRTELNDKQTRTIFKLSDESTDELLNDETFEIVEKRNYKKVGDIVTAYKILNAAGYDIKRPLDQFDRAVLSVCNSEWLEGNRCTTIPIIYRALTGKIGKGDARPTKEQRAAILDSIQILMSRTFISDPSAARSLLKYNDGGTTAINSALLPAWYAEDTTINGNDADTVIFFDRPCPLLAMAKAKRQILTYDTQLLDIPRQQNTTMNIKLKNYAMIRVQEIIAHKQMRPIVTFKEVFEKCRLEKADRKTKLRAREFMLTFFEHLKHEAVIKDFKLTKRGNAFHSIEFSYSKSKK